jgi:hypothetical protein
MNNTTTIRITIDRVQHLGRTPVTLPHREPEVEGPRFVLYTGDLGQGDIFITPHRTVPLQHGAEEVAHANPIRRLLGWLLGG